MAHCGSRIVSLSIKCLKISLAGSLDQTCRQPGSDLQIMDKSHQAGGKCNSVWWIAQLEEHGNDSPRFEPQYGCKSCSLFDIHRWEGHKHLLKTETCHKSFSDEKKETTDICIEDWSQSTSLASLLKTRHYICMHKQSRGKSI